MMFEKRVLRRIIEPRGDEVTGSWRKLHNEEFHNVYSLPIIISHQVKEDEMDHLARRGMHMEYTWERDHYEDVDKYGRIILN
jgi:hypothetical protein